MPCCSNDSEIRMRLYNTLSRSVEELVVEDNTVNMYVCGITPYAPSHLGHAMCAIVFDVIRRYLEYKGYKVNFIQNFTDIDDKILQRATENQELFSDLTARFIDAMHEDEKALAILPPDQEPSATGHIEEIISMIEILIDKEFAYSAENGDVYFSVSSFKSSR